MFKKGCKMKKNIFILLALLFVANISDAAYTHIVYVDKSGSDQIGNGQFTNPVATISKALELAELLERDEKMSALIRLGQGEFAAPDSVWNVDCKWINFRGNGIRNTSIDADLIIIDSEAITGLDDLAVRGCLDIGNTILPVCNVEIMELKKEDGVLDGVWQNLEGTIFYGSKTLSSHVETELEKNIEKPAKQKVDNPELGKLRLRNQLIIKEHIKNYKRKNRTLAIGGFSWEIVRMYWEKVPELKEARDKFEVADDELKKVLMKDLEYKEIMDNLSNKSCKEIEINKLRSSKGKVYRRLSQNSAEYRKVRKVRDETLRVSNEMSLKHILKDYEKKNILFPIDWLRKREIKDYLEIIKINYGLDFELED